MNTDGHGFNPAAKETQRTQMSSAGEGEESASIRVHERLKAQPPLWGLGTLRNDLPRASLANSLCSGYCLLGFSPLIRVHPCSSVVQLLCGFASWRLCVGK